MNPPTQVRWGVCACCETWGRLGTRGLIPECTARWRDAGRLGEWPTRAELVEQDVLMVLATGVPYQVVADRCGVTHRQVCRVVARLRARGVLEAAA